MSELVDHDDLPRVADAFVAALEHGIGATRARLDGGGTVFVWYTDLRDELGALVRVIAHDDELAQLLADRGPVGPKPRVALIKKDCLARVLEVDEGFCSLLGWPAEELVGRRSVELVHPEDQGRAVDNWMKLLSGDGARAVRLRYLCRDGSWAWLETSNELHRSDDGGTVVCCQLVDVSEQMASLEALRHRERLLSRLTETVPVGLFHVAPDRTLSYANTRLRDIFGVAHLGHLDELRAVVPTDQLPVIDSAVASALGAGRDTELELSLPGPRSSVLRCRVSLSAVTDGPTVIGAIGCVMDVTELKTQATRDGLTGLRNRSAIFESLRSALRAKGQSVGLIFVDVDRFKSVNDHWGHSAGDAVLAAVGVALKRAVRRRDRAGRLGGDEFLVVCPDVADQAELDAVARRIEAALGEGVVFEGAVIQVAASLGLALVATGSVSVEQAVDLADKAMYAVKGTRRALGPGDVTDQLPGAVPLRDHHRAGLTFDLPRPATSPV
jgi:diguanylate cyclase (GGDEF)-like protein/PAS domain S-box-containing protein